MRIADCGMRKRHKSNPPSHNATAGRQAQRHNENIKIERAG